MQARVYKNLNNGLWSIKQRIDGKWLVVGHCESCSLVNAKPYVSAARHRAVMNGHSREVFAWVSGELAFVHGFRSFAGRSAVVDGYGRCDVLNGSRVTFRPMDARGFHYVDSGEAFESAAVAVFNVLGHMWVNV